MQKTKQFCAELTVPIGQTSQALVYVPNAVPAGDGTDNLVPLGEAGNTARLRLEAGGTVMPDAQGSVAVNSLRPLRFCPDCGGRSDTEFAIPSLPGGVRPTALRKTRTRSGFEGESRRSRYRTNRRSARDPLCYRGRPLPAPLWGDT